MRAPRIHQLRSALRSFDGWVPSPPAWLIEGMRELFTALGAVRDSDVLDSGVAIELEKAGAPRAVAPPGDEAAKQPAEIVRADAVQRMLLGWIAWRVTLADAAFVVAPATAGEASGTEKPTRGTTDGVPATAEVGSADPQPPAQPGVTASSTDPRTFRRNAERRLRRWHRRIVEDWRAFDELDQARLHALRKRIKRQRYAVEFFAAAWLDCGPDPSGALARKARTRQAGRIRSACPLITARPAEAIDLTLAPPTSGEHIGGVDFRRKAGSVRRIAEYPCVPAFPGLWTYTTSRDATDSLDVR